MHTEPETDGAATARVRAPARLPWRLGVRLALLTGLAVAAWLLSGTSVSYADAQPSSTSGSVTGLPATLLAPSPGPGHDRPDGVVATTGRSPGGVVSRDAGGLVGGLVGAVSRDGAVTDPVDTRGPRPVAAPGGGLSDLSGALGSVVLAPGSLVSGVGHLTGHHDADAHRGTAPDEGSSARPGGPAPILGLTATGGSAGGGGGGAGSGADAGPGFLAPGVPSVPSVPSIPIGPIGPSGPSGTAPVAAGPATPSVPVASPVEAVLVPTAAVPFDWDAASDRPWSARWIRPAPTTGGDGATRAASPGPHRAGRAGAGLPAPHDSVPVPPGPALPDPESDVPAPSAPSPAPASGSTGASGGSGVSAMLPVEAVPAGHDAAHLPTASATVDGGRLVADDPSFSPD